MRRIFGSILLLSVLILSPGCFRHRRGSPASPPSTTPVEVTSRAGVEEQLDATSSLQFGELELAPKGWVPGKTRKAKLHLFSSLRLEGEGAPLQLACFDSGDPALARRWLVRAFRFGRSEPGLLGRFGVQALREKDGTEALGFALGQMTVMVRADPQGVPLLRGYVMDFLRTNQAKVPDPMMRTRSTQKASPEGPSERIQIPLESYTDWTGESQVLPDPGRPPRRIPRRLPTPGARIVPVSTPRPRPTPRPTPRPSLLPRPTPSPSYRPPSTPRSAPTRTPTPTPTPPPEIPRVPVATPPPVSPAGVSPFEARIHLDQGRRLEARGRIPEAVSQYQRAVSLGSSQARELLREISLNYPGSFEIPALPPPPTPVPTRTPTPTPTPTAATRVPTRDPPTTPPVSVPEPDELALLRRDSLIALAAGDHARAHKLLQRASLLGDVQALREAQRLEERYPDLRGGGSDTHPWKPALARAQDAESRGELRAAYSEYLRAVELGSEDALMALRALERGLHRRHFELTDQVWAGDDPVARRQLQELTDRFPEVFPPETIPRTNPETSSKPWLRWALVLLCILGAAILLARGRAIGRVR